MTKQWYFELTMFLIIDKFTIKLQKSICSKIYNCFNIHLVAPNSNAPLKNVLKILMPHTPVYLLFHFYDLHIITIRFYDSII